MRRAAVLMEPFRPALAKRLKHARDLTRAAAIAAFAPELSKLARTKQKRATIAALDVATSWVAWEQMRRHQGLSETEARRRDGDDYSRTARKIKFQRGDRQMGRNILFITTDQQRYDALGCNGGKIAQTPVADRLASGGINYRRAHNQNVVCMPARSTMITGQYVRTHGVVANGVALPPDAPSVAVVSSREGGLPHRAAGQGAFRARLRFAGAMVREPDGAARIRPARIAASIGWNSRCMSRSADGIIRCGC